MLPGDSGSIGVWDRVPAVGGHVRDSRVFKLDFDLSNKELE